MANLRFNRKWTDDGLDKLSNDSKVTTVMQYNILADGLAQNGQFCYATPDILEWDYRNALINDEIRLVDPDILCVEECNRPESLSMLLSDHAIIWVAKLNSPAVQYGCPPDGILLAVR